MLARIDEVDGVQKSRVSWDGRRFLVEVEPQADGARVASAVAAALGEAERLAPADEASAISAYQGGERWLDHDQTVALSRDEARHLALPLVASIAREVGLDEGDARRLETVLHEELERVFERAHAAGGGLERLDEGRPEARRRIEQRLAGFLTPAQADQVLAHLERELE